PLGPAAAAGPAAPPRMATTARTVTKARVRRIPPLLDRLRVDGPTATDECPTIQAEPVDDNRASAKGGRAAVPAGFPGEGGPGGADQRQQGREPGVRVGNVQAGLTPIDRAPPAVAQEGVDGAEEEQREQGQQAEILEHPPDRGHDARILTPERCDSMTTA